MKFLFLILLAIISICFITVGSKPVLQYNRFKHSKELALLKERFPGSNMKLLRELNTTLKKQRASLRMIISMEKELQRTARNLERYEWEPEALALAKNTGDRNIPFSAWAG